jgi:hypothetical protein
VLQGVKVEIVKRAARGSPSATRRSSPTAALVRVYVKPDATWKGKSVTAELRRRGAKKLPLVIDTNHLEGVHRRRRVHVQLRGAGEEPPTRRDHTVAHRRRRRGDRPSDARSETAPRRRSAPRARAS